MQNTKIFDFLIIGCGPWGAAITMSLHKKNYKVLCIEKNLSFSGLAKTTNNMKFHSKLATLQLDNMNKLLMKGEKYNPSSEELIESYREIITKKNLPLLENTKFLDINLIDNKFFVKTSNNQYEEIVSNKVIFATGIFDFPRSLPIKINPENVSRNIQNHDEYKNKQIVCIGGGFSSFENSILLSKHNKVSILYRGTTMTEGLEKGNTFDHKYNKFLNVYSKNYESYNLENINLINYTKINEIKENIILFDNKKIYFDRLLLCIGYDFVSPINKKFNYLKNKKIFEVGQIIGENIMDLHSKGQIYKNQNRLEEVVNLIINEKKISYEDKINLPILHKIKINLKSLIKKYVNII